MSIEERVEKLEQEVKELSSQTNFRLLLVGCTSLLAAVLAIWLAVVK